MIGIASKNSLPKKITGPLLTLLKFFIHFILEPFNFFFCVFISKSLFSYKKIFVFFSRIGNFFNVLDKTFAKLPSPGPSSTKLNFLGFPNFSHAETIQIVIISENKFDIVGAVTKSPWIPKGFFFE